jgi:hypothetical protein
MRLTLAHSGRHIYSQSGSCDLSPEAMTREAIGADQHRILGRKETTYPHAGLTANRPAYAGGRCEPCHGSAGGTETVVPSQTG